MTKAFLFLSVFLLCNVAYSQTEKGTFLVGGTINFSSSNLEVENTDDRNSFRINFNPNFSYLIVDNFSIGVIVPIDYSRYKVDVNESKSFNIQFGPDLRYYFTFNKMAVFPEISYTFGKSKQIGQQFDPQLGQTEEVIIKGDAKNLNIGAGFTYFINSNVGIEAILGYSKLNNKYDQIVRDSESSELYLKFGFQIYLGGK